MRTQSENEVLIMYAVNKQSEKLRKRKMDNKAHNQR